MHFFHHLEVLGRDDTTSRDGKVKWILILFVHLNTSLLLDKSIEEYDSKPRLYCLNCRAACLGKSLKYINMQRSKLSSRYFIRVILEIPLLSTGR